MNTWNLPHECIRDVPDRHQEHVSRADQYVRLIRNRLLRTWDLVRRSDREADIIQPLASTYRVPRWVTLTRFESPTYDIVDVFAWLKRNDSWGKGGSKASSIAKAKDELLGHGERVRQAQQEAALDQAAGATDDRFVRLHTQRVQSGPGSPQMVGMPKPKVARTG